MGIDESDDLETDSSTGWFPLRYIHVGRIPHTSSTIVLAWYNGNAGGYIFAIRITLWPILFVWVAEKCSSEVSIGRRTTVSADLSISSPDKTLTCYLSRLLQTAYRATFPSLAGWRLLPLCGTLREGREDSRS